MASWSTLGVLVGAVQVKHSSLSNVMQLDNHQESIRTKPNIASSALARKCQRGRRLLNFLLEICSSRLTSISSLPMSPSFLVFVTWTSWEFSLPTLIIVWFMQRLIALIRLFVCSGMPSRSRTHTSFVILLMWSFADCIVVLVIKVAISCSTF